MKNAEYSLDDQTLGSFVDGMLDAAHSESVIRAMDQDPEVRDRVHQLHLVKDLMKVGFGHTHAPSAHSKKTRLATWRLFSPRIAASVAALFVVFAAGMLSQPYVNGQPGFPGELLAAFSPVQSDSDNVILHISESDPQQFAAALLYAEKFLQEHRAQGYQVDVVAHAGGLDVMRADVSPLKLQMIEMLSRYDNVHFIGCANAIRMLREKGINPPIIAGVNTENTAFDHIVGRLTAGSWKYIRVDSLVDNPGSV
jgi:intracellular sulfur oxidation DsrE/DsrF family protein